MDAAGSPSANSGAAAAPASAASGPAEYWNSLLRADVEMTPGFNEDMASRMRAAKLTFGDRIHCPFLRPFFISESDDARLRDVTEVIAALGERVISGGAGRSRTSRAIRNERGRGTAGAHRAGV